MEGGDELSLLDQAVLQRQQAEEKVAVDGGHGTAPGHGVGHGTTVPGNAAGAGVGRASRQADSRMKVRAVPIPPVNPRHPGPLMTP